jgi:outer membrane lipoprotein-sorting protein
MLTAPRVPLLVAVLALAVLGGCLGPPTAGPTAETIETRLAQGPSVDTVRGTYTITETVDGGTERTSVRVWTVVGERLRQEIRSPDRPDRVVVANRTRTWLYFPDSNDAYRRGYTVLDRAGGQPYRYAALIDNLDAYRIEYRGRETVANRSTHHVTLAPAANGRAVPEIEFYTYRIGADSRPDTVRPTRVDLWLDTEHWYPLRHELRVAGENRTYTTTVAYENVTFDASIDPARFDFDPTQNGTDVVMDDITTTYRPYDDLARAEARAGIAYGLPDTVGRYRLERIAVVQSAVGRGIKALYLPAGVETNASETHISRPTHPDAVAVTVSPDGTHRQLSGLPSLDGQNRTIAGSRVEFARLEGHWTEVVHTCGETQYGVVGNENVTTDTIGQFVDAATCP